MESVRGGEPGSLVYWTRRCFVCGRENPHGIHALVVVDHARAFVRATMPEALVGLPGVLHGGAVTALLDEAMWYAVWARGVFSVTASIEVRFVRPGPPGGTVLAVAHALMEGETVGHDEHAAMPAQGSERSRRTTRAVARLVDRQGLLVASARGRFAPVEVPAGVHEVLGSRPAGAVLVEELAHWPGAGAPGGKGGMNR